MVSKSDTKTQKSLTQEVYADFPINFDKIPFSGDLAKVTNEEAVKGSIRNLINVMFGEIPFHSDIGSDVRKNLFEDYNIFTAENLTNAIKLTIKQKEGRANLLSVDVYPDADHNRFSVNIYFSLINSIEPISLSLILKRVR